MASLFKSSKEPAMSVSFPDQSRPHTANGHIGGEVVLRLDRDDKGLLVFETVTAKIRTVMVTTWQQGKDYRRQTTQLYGEQILLYDSTTYASDPRSSISLPFGFLLPSATRCLPSSFEGGTRPFFSFTGDMVGSKVARIHWLIKLTANKRGTFAVNERKTLPFLYLQPPKPAVIPPQIFPPPGPSGVLPPYPPAPPDSSAFKTVVFSKAQRTGSLFSKKGKGIVRLTVPSSPHLPSFHPIPYYISILILSPPLPEKYSPSPSSPPPELHMPSPSSLRLQLTRHVKSVVRGAAQTIRQTANSGDLCDFSKEHRVWFAEQKLREDPEEAGIYRWSAEIVCVGEFALGAGPTRGCGMTIDPESTLGMLSSWFTVDLSLPMKGLGNDLDRREFLSFAITSADSSLAGSSAPSDAELFPPGYFESTGKDDDEWDDEK